MMSCLGGADTGLDPYYKYGCLTKINYYDPRQNSLTVEYIKSVLQHYIYPYMDVAGTCARFYQGEGKLLPGLLYLKVYSATPFPYQILCSSSPSLFPHRRNPDVPSLFIESTDSMMIYLP